MKNFQALKELIGNAEADAMKFYDKGNKTAGTRLRATMQLVKAGAAIVRKEVIETKNRLHK